MLGHKASEDTTGRLAKKIRNPIPTPVSADPASDPALASKTILVA
jgi:hypothetical protein